MIETLKPGVSKILGEMGGKPIIDEPAYATPGTTIYDDLKKQVEREAAEEANRAEQDLYPKLNRKLRRAQAKINRRK